MQRRTLLWLVNLAVAAAAVTIVFVFPQYSTIAVYAFLAWFVVSLGLAWSSLGRRAAGPPAVTPPGSPAGSSGAPLPKAAIGPTAPIAFCAYCAADLPPGASRCPACRHPVLSLA